MYVSQIITVMSGDTSTWFLKCILMHHRCKMYDEWSTENLLHTLILFEVDDFVCPQSFFLNKENKNEFKEAN